MSVLLLHMPMASPSVSNLAIEILASRLRLEGISTDTFYATLRFPRTAHLEAFIHSAAGEAIFTPLLFRNHAPSVVVNRFLACDRGLSELGGNLARLFGCAPPTREAIAAEFEVHLRQAEDWLDRCLREIPLGRYKAYGFSIGFDAQRLSSLVLAARLKEREPECQILFGGTAVDGVMGHELLKSFPHVDVICQGDADWRIVALIRTMLEGRGLDAIPGLLFRRHAEIVNTGHVSPGEQLDDLPIPDYESFLDQLAQSEWSREPPIFLFELSRGCWWGEKHHCLFCGLRADGLHFRRKSAARAANEIQVLASRYPQHRVLYATDAILDFQATRAFLPTLAEARRRDGDWKLFFEIKSNISRREVALLAEAGVTTVQPGIESFSDRVLSLMDKGSTAVKNVDLLRSVTTHEITPLYNLIIGTPGEQASDYEETLQLIPRLHHLPPPAQVCSLQLDRFSPYFQAPERFRMSEIEPESVYRIIYPDSSIDLRKMVYRFNFVSPEQFDSRLQAVWARLEAAVEVWRCAYKTRALWWRDLGAQLAIDDEAEGSTTRHILTGASADLYKLCDRGASFTTLRRAMPRLEPDVLRSCLERWREQGWLFRFGSGTYLALASLLGNTQPAAVEEHDHVAVEVAAPLFVSLTQLGGLSTP